MTNQNNNLQSIDSKNKRHSDVHIDLYKILSVLWAQKSLILISTFMAFITAMFVSLSIPNTYRSEALLAPVSSDTDGLGGLASQFGGLASLAGVSLPGGSDDKITMGLEVLKSRKFFANLIEKYDVLVPLMAAEAWDAENNQLLIDSKVYDKEAGLWLRDVKAPRKKEPSVQEAYDVFLQKMKIQEDKETGFIRLSIEHYSPYIAKNWVDMLIFEINETVREQDLSQAERSIAYLHEQIKSTPLAELQAGFFELIQSQTETIMLAKASPEYIFKTVDPAIVPELKAKPQRALICVLGVLLGGMFGVFIVLVRNFMFPKNN